jgi:hypothetical protein
VYDIYCETDTGEYFIVEMQNWAQGYFTPRTLFYAASAIVKQRTKLEKDPNGERGYNHYEIKAVYTIAFLNYIDKSLDERPNGFIQTTGLDNWIGPIRPTEDPAGLPYKLSSRRIG